MNLIPDKIEAYLVEHWRVVWRYWSVRLNAVGVLLASAFFAFPDFALHAWSLIPAEAKAIIPPRYMPLVGVALSAAALVASYVRQRKLPK